MYLTQFKNNQILIDKLATYIYGQPSYIQGGPIEIGLEQAPFVFFLIFFSAFEHVKSLLIMGPNNTKNSSLKCDFHIIIYE